MESTLTLGAGAIGALIGAGIGFGIVRAKLGEVERLQKALFKKFDALAHEQKEMGHALARHDERISALQSDMREIRSIYSAGAGIPTAVVTQPTTNPIHLNPEKP